MQRQEALALLKEILQRQAASPSWISVKEKEVGKYELSLKGSYNKESIQIIIQQKGLTLEEDDGLLNIR